MGISEGKPIPTELRNEEAALRKEIDLEDENTAGMLIPFLLLPLFWDPATCLGYLVYLIELGMEDV